ncbi:hypothetical protein ACH5RR_021953 [Cinchona calisaya]|uniref:Uncharacterized protein n=1 Tax=Cinchona calisaya TaxID=153742 RepID=A0ABD2Z8B5_9GENT
MIRYAQKPHQLSDNRFHAKKFQYESTSFCCDNGNIKLACPEISEELHDLFTSQSEESIEFQRNIRAYNNIFSFMSFGVKLNKDLASNKKGVYTFRVQGQIYHDLPGLIPNEDGRIYFQLYFYDLTMRFKIG